MHTAGPWSVMWNTGQIITDPELIEAAKAKGIPLPEPIERLTNAGQRVVMAESGERRVAAVDSVTDFARGKGYTHACPERDANAALIAAAPALLEAVQDAREALNAITQKDSDWMARAVRALHVCADAVALAKKEQG